MNSKQHSINRDKRSGQCDLTWDATVGCFQVSSEIFRARVNNVSYRTHTELAPSQTGTGLIQQVCDVSRTAKVPVVMCHTPTNPLPSVLRLVDNNHLICRAWRVEHLELTELRTVCCQPLKLHVFSSLPRRLVKPVNVRPSVRRPYVLCHFLNVRLMHFLNVHLSMGSVHQFIQ